MKNLLYLFVAVLFSSCAFHTGTLTGFYTDLNTPYKITASASGYAKAEYIFGIGGLSKKQLVQDAKENMYMNTPLEKNQVYANVSVNFKRSLYIVYAKTEVFITADILSKRIDDDDFIYLNEDAKNSNKNILAILNNDEINVPEIDQKEPVYYLLNTGKFGKGKVIGKNEELYKISLPTAANTITLRKEEIYRMKNLGELQKLIGRYVTVPSSFKHAPIIAINPYTREVLLKDENNKLASFSLE